MTRVIVAVLALMVLASAATASPWPKVPPHPYPVDAEDVKEFWSEALPRPEKPRRGDANYDSQLSTYYQIVATGRSLIRRLEAGFFDREAHLSALRHNLAYYQRKDLQLWVETTEEAIVLAEAELLQPLAPAIASAFHLRSTITLRTSRLSLARLGSSGGLQPRRTWRPSPPSTHSRPSPPCDHSCPDPEPEIIYIEEEDDSNECPAPNRRPRPYPPATGPIHRPPPEFEVKPRPPARVTPSPSRNTKPSAPPRAPERSAPTRTSSNSGFPSQSPVCRAVAVKPTRHPPVPSVCEKQQ